MSTSKRFLITPRSSRLSSQLSQSSQSSAPTSGGKTLVAEVLLLRALLQHDGTMALLVVPFIALAMEKRDYLREVWAPLQVPCDALGFVT